MDARLAVSTMVPNREVSEDAFLERLRSGDEAAFEELVRTTSRRLLALSRRLLRDDEEARDAVQDTFLSAFKSLRGFRGGCRLASWLSRIAVNHCLMRLRSRSRKPEVAIEALLPFFAEDGHQVRSSTRWEPNLEDELVRKDLFAIVRRAIDELPERYRTVMLLRDVEDMDTAEVARLLGVTPNTVKIRLHRARQALRTLVVEPRTSG